MSFRITHLFSVVYRCPKIGGVIHECVLYTNNFGNFKIPFPKEYLVTAIPENWYHCYEEYCFKLMESMLEMRRRCHSI